MKSHSQSSNNHTRAPARFQQQSDDTVTADCVGGSPNAGDDISTEKVGRDRDDHPNQMWDHELPARTNPQVLVLCRLEIERGGMRSLLLELERAHPELVPGDRSHACALTTSQQTQGSELVASHLVPRDRAHAWQRAARHSTRPSPGRRNHRHRKSTSDQQLSSHSHRAGKSSFAEDRSKQQAHPSTRRN